MDPDVTLRLIFDAYSNEDREAVIELTEDLREWVRANGFMPKINPSDFIRILTILQETAEEW